MEETKLFMSDVVGDDYKTWQPGEIIGLSGGTGTGKTELALGKIAKEAQHDGKKVLYLCNRIDLEDDVEKDIKEKFKLDEKMITIMGYQKLQTVLENGEAIGEYDYLFCDECHYFFTDAVFNDATDIAYNFVMNRKDAVVILMSATAAHMFDYLISTGKIDSRHLYYTPQDYSYVDHVIIYERRVMFQLVDQILSQDDETKVICFVNGRRMKEAYEYYGDRAHYMCSASNKDPVLRRICGLPKRTDDEIRRYASEDKKAMKGRVIKRYSSDLITFDQRILFTTRAMENGVTFKDRRIKAIFSELIDADALVQSLGRKRPLPGGNDTCTFFVRRFQKNWIKGSLRKIRGWLSQVKQYSENREFFNTVYLKAGYRDKLRLNDILYYGNEGTCINEMRYQKYQLDSKIYQRILDIGYDAALIEILGETLASKICKDNTMPCDYDPLMEFLENIRGKRLYAEEQAEIKDLFKKYGLNLGKVILRGKRPPGIHALNGVLETRYGEDYTPRFRNKDPKTGNYLRDKHTKNEDGSDNCHYDKSYWIFDIVTNDETVDPENVDSEDVVPENIDTQRQGQNDLAGT